MELLISISARRPKYTFVEYAGNHHASVMRMPIDSSDIIPNLDVRTGSVLGYRKSKGSGFYECVFTQTGLDTPCLVFGSFIENNKFKPLTEEQALRYFNNPALAEKKASKPSPYEKQMQRLLDTYGNPERYKKIKTAADAIEYTKSVWLKARRVLQLKGLKLPTFVIDRTEPKLQTLGSWAPYYRRFSLNRRLFNTPEAVALLTILHELAHQCNTELDKIPLSKDDPTKGHHSAWIKRMKQIGIPASQFNTHSQDLFSTKKEIQDKQKRKEEVDAYREKWRVALTEPHFKETQIRLFNSELPIGTPIRTYKFPGEWVNGIYAGEKVPGLHDYRFIRDGKTELEPLSTEICEPKGFSQASIKKTQAAVKKALENEVAKKLSEG